MKRRGRRGKQKRQESALRRLLRQRDALRAQPKGTPYRKEHLDLVFAEIHNLKSKGVHVDVY